MAKTVKEAKEEKAVLGESKAAKLARWCCATYAEGAVAQLVGVHKFKQEEAEELVAAAVLQAAFKRESQREHRQKRSNQAALIAKHGHEGLR